MRRSRTAFPQVENDQPAEPPAAVTGARLRPATDDNGFGRLHGRGLTLSHETLFSSRFPIANTETYVILLVTNIGNELKIRIIIPERKTNNA